LLRSVPSLKHAVIDKSIKSRYIGEMLDKGLR